MMTDQSFINDNIIGNAISGRFPQREVFASADDENVLASLM